MKKNRFAIFSKIEIRITGWGFFLEDCFFALYYFASKLYIFFIWLHDEQDELSRDVCIESDKLEPWNKRKLEKRNQKLQRKRDIKVSALWQSSCKSCVKCRHLFRIIFISIFKIDRRIYYIFIKSCENNRLADLLDWNPFLAHYLAANSRTVLLFSNLVVVFHYFLYHNIMFVNNWK